MCAKNSRSDCIGVSSVCEVMKLYSQADTRDTAVNVKASRSLAEKLLYGSSILAAHNPATTAPNAYFTGNKTFGKSLHPCHSCSELADKCVA